MAEAPWILHIESSGPHCSVAISHGTKIVASQRSKQDYSHAGTITVLIQQCLKEAGVLISELSSVSCCEGPGSYTGLRVGQSVSKAICMAQNIPLTAYTAFELMINHPKAELDVFILTIIKARASEGYFALYTQSQEILNGPASIDLTSISFLTLLNKYDPKILVNEDMEVLHPYTPQIITYDARNLVNLGLKGYELKTFKSLYTFTPLYIKPPNITQPRER